MKKIYQLALIIESDNVQAITSELSDLAQMLARNAADLSECGVEEMLISSISSSADPKLDWHLVSQSDYSADVTLRTFAREMLTEAENA